MDLEVLSPYRVSAVATDAIERSGAPDLVWLEYAYCKLHPVEYAYCKLHPVLQYHRAI